MLASAVAETALPIHVSRIIDEIGRGEARPLLAAAVIVLLGALVWALNYARRALTAEAVGNVVLVSRVNGHVFSAIFPVLNVLAGSGRALVACLVARAVSPGTLSVGDWFLFIQGVQLFWFPLTSIASFWSQFQQRLAAAGRVFALIDAEPKVVQTGADAPALAGEIRFERLEFIERGVGREGLG